MNTESETYQKIMRMRPGPNMCLAVAGANECKLAGHSLATVYAGKRVYENSECNDLKWREDGYSVWKLPVRTAWMIRLQGLPIEILKQGRITHG